MHIYRRTWMLGTFLLITAGCLGKHKNEAKSSDLNSDMQNFTEVNLVSTQEAARYFETASKEVNFASNRAALAKTPMRELKSGLNDDVKSTRFVANSKVINMSQNALSVSAHRASTQSKEPSSQSVEEFLSTQSIDLGKLTSADMTASYMALRALVSGDVESDASNTVQSLNLTGPTQQIRDLTKLADLGKKTWDNLLTGVPAALDPATWQLIDRNRRILTVATEIVDRVGPKDLKTRSYNQMLRHMIKASEIITGPSQPSTAASPEIPDWDP